jgi:hypothetical protein
MIISLTHTALDKKKSIKHWGKETLAFLKKIGYIENDYAGRVEIDLNLTRGGLRKGVMEIFLKRKEVQEKY